MAYQVRFFCVLELYYVRRCNYNLLAEWVSLVLCTFLLPRTISKVWVGLWMHRSNRWYEKL